MAILVVMPNVDVLYAYFQEKGSQWRKIGGSVENYIRMTGRGGLAQEFQADGNFRNTVCPYFKTLGELQLRATVVKSLEGLVGVAFGVPLIGTMDIVIGAIADACGYKTIGDQLLEAAPILIVLGSIVALGLGIAGSSK
jgi:hypothetical protein